jgi:hypothetical protein
MAITVETTMTLSYGAQTTTIGVAGDRLVVATGATEIAGHPYDPIAMRWWRLRPEADALVAEYGPDGLQWNELGRDSAGAGLASANLQIQLAVNAAQANASEARFATLDVCP